MRRTLRCAPFLAVALCFLLPFFSVSSCGAGTETSASGLDIVTGSRLIKQQVKQPFYLGEQSHVRLGPVGPDHPAQTASDAARPWTIITLFSVALGGCLVVIVNRHWRGVGAVATGVALMAWVEAGIAFDRSVPKRSTEEFSLEVGFVLVLVILIATVVWEVWAISRAHDADMLVDQP
jgi:hypothetical protein